MLWMLLLDRLNGRKFDNYVPKCHCLKQQYIAAGRTPDIHNLCFIIEKIIALDIVFMKKPTLAHSEKII